MPRAYPISKRYVYCDESSFIKQPDPTDRFMSVGALVIPSVGIQLLLDELKAIRGANFARGEIKWNNTTKRETKVRIDFIDHLWTLLKKKRVNFHVRFAPFDEYSHDDYPGKRFDTTNRMFYQLLLHRAVKHYGKWDRLYIRPDDGDCTANLEQFKVGLESDGWKRYKANPNCIESIICLSSKTEPVLQFLDVSLGALTALRNNRALGESKQLVADHMRDKLDGIDLTKDLHDRTFSIWNAKPQRREPIELGPLGSDN
jgi:hypothetical protein